MPARISRGLSRNGRLGRGATRSVPVVRGGVMDVTLAGISVVGGYYGMNVNLAWPSTASRSHGQKNHVFRGRVCARTRT